MNFSGCFHILLLILLLFSSSYMDDVSSMANPNRIIVEKESKIEFKNFRLKYRMEFKEACPQRTKLILLSMARRDGFEKRKGIRQTWMRDSVPGEVIRFLIANGPPTEAEDVQQKLDEEQEKNGDLVFLHGFNDTYSHIHIKWYAGLQWQQTFCADAEWVLKADDDSIVHLRRLAYWTEKKFRQIVQQTPLVYFGHRFYSPVPIRDTKNKWNVYPADMYPDYVSGFVYLTTPATVRAVLSHSADVIGFNMDDVVFTGILAELAKVELSDQPQHFTWAISDYDEKCGECVDGVPTALTSLVDVNTVQAFADTYRRIKSIKCRRRGAIDCGGSIAKRIIFLTFLVSFLSVYIKCRLQPQLQQNNYYSRNKMHK